jgi:Mannosylglycerate hydrolase MGH1-like glycoside hydrolase domain
MALADAELDPLVHAGAAKVLHRAWQPKLGYCRPNRHSYPHLWLWDSCFHSIAWSAQSDARALRELAAVFAGQLPNGFLPHMRYGRRTYARGPLPDVSSFTQPPVYSRALKAAKDAGLAASDQPLFDRLTGDAARALDALWRERSREGLLVIVHPWEAGTDDSPRWDSWIGSTTWRRRLWTKIDRELLDATVFSPDGVAIDNSRFVVAAASFNAIAADAAIILGDLIDDEAWRDRGRALAAALDAAAWDDDQQLWSDVDFVGGGSSVRIPTSDAVLPALCTPDSAKAEKALVQLLAPNRFGAPFGPRFVPMDEPAYNPEHYWRGPAWPQLNFLDTLAAARCGRRGLAAELATTTKRGALRAGFSEYWNPETGRGLGAKPQTWAAVAAAL